MRKSILIALLSSVALPAMAADMPVKAPLRPEAIIDDWSGIYTGVAAGGAWGREKLSNDVSSFDTGANSSLFGTGAPRLFSSPVIIQPAFSMSDCLITNCNRVKMNGVMAGGFAGAQKQLGNWVIGIEGSWDWTGMKKSHSAIEDSIEFVTRFQPTTTFPVTILPTTVTVTGTALVPGQVALVTGTASVPGQAAPVTGSALVPLQVATVSGNAAVGGQVALVTGTAAVPGQTAAVTGSATVAPVTGTIDSGTTGLGPITISLPIVGDITLGPVPVPLSGSVNVPAQTAAVTGSAAVAPATAPVTGSAAVLPSNAAVTGTATIVPVVAPVTGSAAVAPVTAPVTGSAAVAPVTAPLTATGTVPGQTVNITLGLPAATSVRALVTRSADLETKIDQIADVRGKFGLTNVFFGPNVLLYGTGGFAVGHFNKSLSISQTTALCTTQVGACVTTGQASRTDTFSATSGDTRLGWVVGAGIDWKLGPNFVLGALYRHHEFPKGTVSFSEGTNTLGFGTTRASVDSIQGRLSWLFPIH